MATAFGRDCLDLEVDDDGGSGSGGEKSRLSLKRPSREDADPKVGDCA